MAVVIDVGIVVDVIGVFVVSSPAVVCHAVCAVALMVWVVLQLLSVLVFMCLYLIISIYHSIYQ